MLPFQNNFSQYMADIYASTSYYQSLYGYPPLDNYWNANYEHPPPLHNISPPETLVKIEQPTRTKEKIKKIKPKITEQSSVSCNGVQEQSDSPQLKSRQKEGRNINSNIFHQMLKSIRNDGIFDKILDKVFVNYDLLLNKKDFLEMLQKKITKLNPYVSTAKMKSFLNVPSRPKVGYIKQNTQLDYDFLKVLRITSRYYLNYIHPLYVYNKLKLQKKSKRFHMQGIRTILGTIRK